MITTLDIVPRLIGNAIRYSRLRFLNAGAFPQAASLEITQRCVAKCVMCNIWKNSSSDDSLTLEDWGNLLDSDFFQDLRELDITGGEPFILDNLPDLFQIIADLKKRRFPKLKSVAVTTNGLLTEKVLTSIEKILDQLSRASIGLVVVCALDGIGEAHEKIRRYPDAWKKVDMTIEKLVNLRKNYSDLVVGLKTTILPQNVSELTRITQYAGEKGLFTIISPIIITAGRYLNADMVNQFTFQPHQIDELIRFFKSNASKWSYHNNALTGYFETGRMRKPCSCGFNYIFIRSNGDLFLCPLMSEYAGSVKNVAISELYRGSAAKGIRRKVAKTPDCRRCTEPGLERYSLVFEGKRLLTMLLKDGNGAFLSSFRHMGLDKYLD